jgi:hypothetical protein
VGRVQAHLESGCSRSWGGEHAGVGDRRRPAAVAAAVRAPARLRLGVNNKRPWGVKCYLGKVLGGSGCKGNGQRRGCSGGGGNGGMEEAVARGEREMGQFYRRARSGDEGVTA